MEKINFKERFNNLTDKIKFGFINNKFTAILGTCTIIPIIIALNIWDGNAVIGLAVVPILYRIICNIILWIIKKKGRPENTKLFNNISRISVFIGFFILACLSTALGREEMGFIEIILLCICIAYFDKLLILIFKAITGATFNGAIFSSGSSVESVDSLMNNTKITFDRSNGKKIYQDTSGRTIGMSTYNEKTGETIYWNENMQFIGKSEKDKYGNERYFDSKLNYKGQSEKNSNGYTTYYDEKLNYKGKSRSNSNGTDSYFKQ